METSITKSAIDTIIGVDVKSHPFNAFTSGSVGARRGAKLTKLSTVGFIREAFDCYWVKVVIVLTGKAMGLVEGYLKAIRDQRRNQRT